MSAIYHFYMINIRSFTMHSCFYMHAGSGYKTWNKRFFILKVWQMHVLCFAHVSVAQKNDVPSPAPMLCMCFSDTPCGTG